MPDAPTTIPVFSFQPRKPSHRRPRPTVPPDAAPPATLTLVSAYYDENEAILTLAFDRAVDASGLSAAQIMVADGSFNAHTYAGSGAAVVVSPTTIQVTLAITGAAAAGPVTMDASALTGLTAVDDGGTWAGVSELGLPFDG